MPGIVQELDLIINQATLGRTVADAKKAGADIGNAIGNAPAVKDAAHKLGEAISTEMKKAAESTKMDMASLASASGPLRQAVNPMTAAMSAAAVATSSLGTASTGAAPGLKMAEKAIFNLAAQAASAPGPIGKLAEAFLTFGAGGPIAVGVAATLGAVILALGSIKGAADKATESLRKMNDQFAAQQAGRAGAIAQIDVQINDLKTHIKESQQSLAELLNRASAFGAVGGAAAEVGLFGKQFKEAKAEIDRARASLKQLQQERDALFAASAFGSETAGHFSSSLSPGAGHGRQATAAIPEDAEAKLSRVHAKVKEVTDEIIAAGTLNDEILAHSADAVEGAILTGADLTKQAMDDMAQDQHAAADQHIEDILKAHGADQDAIDAMMAAHVDLNSLVADFDKEDADRKKANHIAYLEHLEEQARRLEGIVGSVMNIATAWGVVSDSMGKVLTGLSQMATDTAGLAKSIASGDVLGAVQSGVNLIGDIGGMFHHSKDPGRMKTNEEMYQRAMNGDPEALEFLRTHSVVSQHGSVGWGSQAAADDAHAKYMEAKAVQDARAQPAKDAANAQHDAEIAAMQKQAGLDQQRLNEQAQVSQHQAQSAMDHRAQVFKDANRLGLGSAAANTGVLFQAAAIAGQGALGHDSPLYVEAEKKAEDALRDLERQVEQAQKQVDDAKQTKADAAGGISSAFTVQRTLTESSAGRIVGELTTQTFYLKDIRDAVVGGPGAVLAAGAGLTPDVHVHLDGQVIAKVVGKHQHAKLQQAQAMTGNSNMT